MSNPSIKQFSTEILSIVSFHRISTVPCCCFRALPLQAEQGRQPSLAETKEGEYPVRWSRVVLRTSCWPWTIGVLHEKAVNETGSDRPVHEPLHQSHMHADPGWCWLWSMPHHCPQFPQKWVNSQEVCDKVSRKQETPDVCNPPEQPPSWEYSCSERKHPTRTSKTRTASKLWPPWLGWWRWIPAQIHRWEWKNPVKKWRTVSKKTQKKTPKKLSWNIQWKQNILSLPHPLSTRTFCRILWIFLMGYLETPPLTFSTNIPWGASAYGTSADKHICILRKIISIYPPVKNPIFWV